LRKKINHDPLFLSGFRTGHADTSYFGLRSFRDHRPIPNEERFSTLSGLGFKP
jgi:hypothetical protein